MIPTIWEKKFLKFFYLSTALAAISNTDYEGEIKAHGDKVEVNYLQGGESHEYVKGKKLVYTELESATRTLLIDRGRSFQFPADYIDKSQAMKSLDYVNKWSEHLAQITKRDIEHIVLSEIFTEVDAANAGANAGADTADYNLGSAGAPKALVKTDIIDDIVNWGDVLDQQNIPDDGRWLVLPTWAAALIKKSELRDASITGDNQSVLRNGRIGMIDRFEIFSSRNLLQVTDSSGKKAWNAMAGHKSAITFATQLTATERMKNPDTFGELIRSLQSFGFAVMQPSALEHLYISRS
ncbi:MAG TPA: hypothetical protein DCS43_08080 [Verrucomicrobia bacterium]|nr:hypothetical protein [Verrucomicrobiota bacterium]